MYIYPENLKAKATLWFWSLSDLLLLGIVFAIAFFFLAVFGVPYLLMVSILFMILTIRIDDYSIMDFLKSAVRFFLKQKLYLGRR